jgi:hypothetical protein
MRIRRDIASIPVRSAKETWRAVIDLVTGKGTLDQSQLEAASSIMESLIADETPAKCPIVFKGSGPRVLIYLLFNEDAMEAGAAIDGLNENPTAGDWRVTAPCEAEDVSWMNNSLKTRAPRISVHDVDHPPEDEKRADGADQASKSFQIDWGALGKS